MAQAFDTGLALLVFAVAVRAIAARDTFAAVAAFVAYGLLLALIWVRLAAPDVALTEAALGSGLTGGLLMGAITCLRRSETAPPRERPGATVRRATAGLCALVSAGLAAVVLLFPEPAPTLAPQDALSSRLHSNGLPVRRRRRESAAHQLGRFRRARNARGFLRSAPGSRCRVTRSTNWSPPARR